MSVALRPHLRRTVARAGVGAAALLAAVSPGLMPAMSSAAAADATGTEGGSLAPVAPLDVLPVQQADVIGGAHHPLRLAVRGRTPTASPLLTGTTATGYTPAQVRSYLGLTGTGAGQTIAIVSAYDAPKAASDLAVFNKHFGLPAPPSFTKVNQTGGTKMPRVNAGWALETALDVQWAHAVAPGAAILLVQATNSSLGNLLAAVSYAAKQPGVTVISGSWGTSEYSGQQDQDYRCRLTTALCVFASGDNGNPATYPATSPAALGVGGTTLVLTADGEVVSEQAWAGSGGGVSLYSAKPGYQEAVTSADRRASPDVSYDADEVTGFPVYSSTAYERQTGWFQLGGTSAGAPQWAGILAAANQLRRTDGKPPLAATTKTGATPAHTALYDSAASLADIVVGANGTCGAICTAGPGYDTVTGLGSPVRGMDAVLRAAP